MDTFSIKNAISFGWDKLRENFWHTIGFVFVLLVISILSTSIADSSTGSVFRIFVLMFDMFVVQMLLGMALTIFFLRSLEARQEYGKVLKSIFNFKKYIKYTVTNLLYGLITFIGLILFIVPGIIFSIVYGFSWWIVMDKGFGPIQALKESARITKGHRWKLFLFTLVIVGINLLGALALLVGLLITIPVSVFAIAHIYKHISGQLALVKAEENSASQHNNSSENLNE